ncbi:hypothetical protein [Candidatus Magnetobacterium casense]|uniref:Uncharacterized protein n=1 Tax=Candidatus Magnetobacterium casense TaxID=1455061 RepID=A0ABS6S352_9BACT|nr:hypothetical protein [Candidatus Magnetobacterium casensis]MBV6342828.1 hypothetical protein [Candidatus Magnetobacterium casensis]
MSVVLMVAVYIWIWMNVVEFEWDMKSLTDAMTGHLSLADLLGSLPGSAIGFLLHALHVGSITLLPVTFVVRLGYLMAHRYLVWTGRGFTVDRDRLARDFGLERTDLEGVPAVV